MRSRGGVKERNIMTMDSLEKVYEALGKITALRARGGIDNEGEILRLLDEIAPQVRVILMYEDPKILKNILVQFHLGPELLDQIRITRRLLGSWGDVAPRVMWRLNNLANVLLLHNGEPWNRLRPLGELLKAKQLDVDAIREFLDSVIKELKQVPECQSKENGP